MEDVFCGFRPGPPPCSFSAPSRPPGPLARRPPHSRWPPAVLLPACRVPARSPRLPPRSLGASRRRRVALGRPARGSRPPCGQGQWVVSALFLKTVLETPRTQAVRSPRAPRPGHHRRHLPARHSSGAPGLPRRRPQAVRGVSGMGSLVSSGGPPGPLADSPGAQGARAQGGGRPADSGSGTRGP